MHSTLCTLHCTFHTLPVYTLHFTLHTPHFRLGTLHLAPRTLHPLLREGGIKWPVQHRLCFFSGFTWTVHFKEAFFVVGGGIKRPVQHRLSFFRGFTWTVHYIEAFFVAGELKWSNHVVLFLPKPCFRFCEMFLVVMFCREIG